MAENLLPRDLCLVMPTGFSFSIAKAVGGWGGLFVTIPRPSTNVLETRLHGPLAIPIVDFAARDARATTSERHARNSHEMRDHCALLISRDTSARVPRPSPLRGTRVLTAR